MIFYVHEEECLSVTSSSLKANIIYMKKMHGNKECYTIFEQEVKDLFVVHNNGMAAGGLWFCLHSLQRSDINEQIQKVIKHVPDDSKSVVIIFLGAMYDLTSVIRSTHQLLYSKKPFNDSFRQCHPKKLRNYMQTDKSNHTWYMYIVI